MANTVIQLKYSTVTATPTSLNVAEPAYSYTSNTLFIGSPAGTGAIAIGGKFYLDQQQDIYNTANAAFIAANTGSAAAAAFNQANAAFIAANSAGAYANSAFLAANIADNKAVTAGSYANSAFLAANIADNKAVTAGSYANSAFATANNEAGVNLTQNNSITAAFTAANSAGVYANGAFVAANTADAKAISAGTYANGAFAAANTAQNSADAAFTRANNSLNANTGGVITGPVTVAANLTITGNLTVIGNTVTTDIQTLNIADPLIYLAANNYSGDAVEIGFAANYYDGATQRHTGVFREASNKEFYVFDNYDKEPDANLIDINDASFRIATLNANLKSQSITLNGQNLQTYVDGAYNKANAAFNSANNINGVNVTQNNSITAAFTAANSAGSYANSAFIRANNSLDRTTGGSITGSIGVTSNVYAGNVIANSAFTSLGGTTKLQLTDIGLVSVQVAGQEFKFGASGIESNSGIYGGASGVNKLLLNNQTTLVSDRFDIVKIQTGEDGIVKNEFTFANNTFIAPGEITAGSVVAGGINVVPTLASSFNTANAAFAQANTDVTGVSVTAGDYGIVTGGYAYIPGFKLEANGRISQANSTLLQVDTSMITSGIFSVARGGTGAGSFTTNGVLLGQGTSALTTASSSTEGHVLTINNTGVPTFAHLSGGTF
jgi:hypothetical protein